VDNDSRNILPDNVRNEFMTIVDITCQADKALLLTYGPGVDAEPVKP